MLIYGISPYHAWWPLLSVVVKVLHLQREWLFRDVRLSIGSGCDMKVFGTFK